MHPRAYYLLLWLTLQGLPTALPAQNLDQYDARLDYFESTGQQDSFLYYAGEKARLARQADNLALWAWILVETHDLASDDPNDALKYLDKALIQQWRAPADSAACEPFMYIQAYRGYYLSSTGRIWQAVQAYEKARAWYERYHYDDPDFEVVEMVYKPLGNHYTRLGDNEKALAVFQKALTALPPEDVAGNAGLLNNIGIAQWNRGELQASEKSYKLGLALPGLPAQLRALLHTGIARTELDEGRHTLACQNAETALRLLQKVPVADEGAQEYRIYAYLTAGMALTRTGQYAGADRYLKRAATDARSIFGAHSREAGKIEIALAALNRARGNLPEALTAANRALSAVLPGFRPRRPEENPAATLFYEENSIFEALEEKAVVAEALYRQKGELMWLTMALECHDLAWQAEALLRQVYQYRSSKLELQQTSRTREEAAMNIARTLFEKTGQAIYREKAFALAERSKAALLLEALQDNLIRQRLAGSDARFSQITALQQSAAYFERQLLLHPGSVQAPQWRSENDAIRGQIAALERAIYQAYPTLAGAGAPGDIFLNTFKITEGEILTEYFVSRNWLDVFVLSGSVVIAWHRVPNDADLQSLSSRFLTFFENAGAIIADPAGYLETAYALWQKIIPAETASAQRLTIVPDGFLNFIPFEALVTALPEGAPSLRTAAYLIRRQEIRYAWSLATLRQQEALISKAPKFLLGVAPLFEGGERGLAPLAAGKAEWQTLPAGKIQTLLGPLADTAHFITAAGQYRILHLSTHARADLRENRPPLIELYDAALLLPDIYALPLQADLVILSACQTGLGVEQKGEGVMSLARAFAQGGAACILSSLWSVNDRSTVRLFQDFYHETAEGQPVAAALRRAKLNYIDDKSIAATGQSPYFWAGMVAVGSNREINMPHGFAWGIFGWLGLVVSVIVGLAYFMARRRR